MRRTGSEPPALPGYTFVKPLGSGGFSDVYLYDQKLPKRRVAVKVLLTEDLPGANQAAFVAEANLMAQLSAHPYIVTIYHADVAGDGRPYFVMEYCSGPSLAERYKVETFGVADALRIGVRLSSAVATAHGAGILHRDIKPANVLTNDYGWPALTDFGISSALEDEALPVHTGTLADLLEGTGDTGSASVGMSVPWSPPEMFEDDPQPDIRSDVFSLAATLYTVLAGHTPFEVRGRSNGALDLIGRIERGAVTALDRPDVPRSLVAVLQKGMESDRERRFGTAIEFARALQRVELELGYAPTAIDVPNLQIAARERVEGDDDDATRVRSVATIDAQPAPAPAPASRPRTTEPPAGAETVVRGATRVVAQPVDAVGEHTVVRPRAPVVTASDDGSTASDTEPVEPRSRRNRVVAWIGGGIAAIVAAVVIVSIVVSGGNPVPAKPSPSSSGGSAVVPTIPTPVLAGVAVEGSSLVFTVTNPDPEDGDGFVWRQSNRTESEPARSNADGKLVVEPYTAGQVVCVSVGVLRSGRDSANPLEACYPGIAESQDR